MSENNNNNENNAQETTSSPTKEEFLASLAEKSMEDMSSSTFQSETEIRPEDMFNNDIDAIEKAKIGAQKEEADKEAGIGEIKEEKAENKDTKETLDEEENKDEVSGEDKEAAKEKPEEGKEDKKLDGDKGERGSEEKGDILPIDLEKKYHIKVDGKMVEITGAELQAKASGELAVEKRFQEVDKVKKEWQNEKEADEKVRLERRDRMIKGDVVGVLSEVFDLPAYTLKENLIESLKPEFQRRSQMSDAQIEAQRVLDERKYYKDSYESKLREEEEAQKAHAEKLEQDSLNQEIQEARETHNISEEQWDAAYKHLDATLDADKDITVDMVVEEASKNAPKAQEAKTEVNFSDLADKALEPYKKHINDDFRQQLIDFMEITPDLTKDQLDQIVKASVQKGLEQKLLGADSGKEVKPLTKAEKLKKLQEQALEKSMPNNPDPDRNWF